MYYIQGVNIQKFYINNLVMQKIKSLDVIAKLFGKISEMRKKNFIFKF